MIATGAIHITMDVTANFVITPDIASPDGSSEINTQISQFIWSPKSMKMNCF
jgi:hypothetical protein